MAHNLTQNKRVYSVSTLEIEISNHHFEHVCMMPRVLFRALGLQSLVNRRDCRAPDSVRCAFLWHPVRMSKNEGADAAPPRTRLPAKTAAAQAAAPKAAPAGTAPVASNDEARPVLEMESTERNALLSSLRAQTSAKKATQEHRDEAQRLLDSYKQGSSKDKVELLLSLRDKGVKNLNWTHQFKEKVTRDSTTECASTGGMFTKSKIFQINGLVERDMTDAEAAETLEDLLTEAETLYGYPRQHVAHRKNPRLDRWYYKWAEGETSREIFGS